MVMEFFNRMIYIFSFKVLTENTLPPLDYKDYIFPLKINSVNKNWHIDAKIVITILPLIIISNLYMISQPKKFNSTLTRSNPCNNVIYLLSTSKLNLIDACLLYEFLPSSLKDTNKVVVIQAPTLTFGITTITLLLEPSTIISSNLIACLT